MPNSIVSISGPTVASNPGNLASASTLDELLACVPRVFQPHYRPVLREFHDIAVKVSHAQTALENFRRHEAGGTFPPMIQGGLRVPTLQFSKEYADSSGHQTWTSAAETDVHQARRSFLVKAIEIKNDEVSHLQGLISDVTAKARTKVLLDSVWSSLATTFAAGINAEGKTTYSTFFMDEYKLCQSQGHNWLRKSAAIGFAKHHREVTAKLAKLTIKKDTDVEMTGLSTNDVKRTIDEAVARALQKSRNNNSKSTLHSEDRSRASSDCHRESNQEGSQTPQPRSQTTSTGKSRKRKREWEQETQEEVARLASQVPGTFKVQDAFSYPEGFFQSTSHVRSRFSLLHSSLEYVNSFSTFSSKPFIGQGVDLPGQFALQLSLNGKFCLYAQKDTTMVPAAMKALRRTVEIKAFFAAKPASKAHYIPRFHIKSDWTPPTETAGLPEALDAMEAALFKQISALPHKAYLRNPEVRHLKEFLTEKKYLVKITDKNLGLAVVTSDWYTEQCQEHLSNTRAYAPRQIKLDSLKEEYDIILNTKRWTPAIARYLSTADCEIPRFHVIPKVHKTPWSSRPIIPSHSWITSKASEVVDYFLQPIVKSSIPVLQSTKDFVNRIKDVKLNPGKTVWLVTGDVKAMYTNIPPDAAISVVGEMLAEKRKSKRSNTAQDITTLLEFVLRNNCFSYLEDTYIQNSGLAMGTACAPAVANLYCASHETRMARERPFLNFSVKFYGRYIDDIFLIFEGSEERLHEFFQHWKIPELEIAWEYSQSTMHFLDVQVHINNGRLVTSIYEKNLNKHMYIPFSSAHPLAVKKGMVKAERMRFRYICSEERDWLAADKRLLQNLLRRGYPLSLLVSWFTEALTQPPVNKKVVILPSSYNPVWEHVNMGNLERAFYSNLREPYLNKYLKEHLGQVTLGLRRGWNMFDVYNRENLTILTSLASL